MSADPYAELAVSARDYVAAVD
ncbi:MAG: hypothetical protein QOH73_1273, partial [Gaiellaceae bacterium]|nr:hypothetical protein [Gaiellaceae bacterium]